MNPESSNKFTNALISETSPYLLQHAHNPVNWLAWGNEAFTKAKDENKLLLVSIGYAACHWCHVMEHQSFENEEVAKIMNANFVCIKVDREERPDVDQIYMTAVQLLTGSGGWPLNCFALPDGRPVYGGTYFTKEQWIQLLEGISLTYKHDRARLERAAEEISAAIEKHESINERSSEKKLPNGFMDEIISNWSKHFDDEFGGDQRAPKFAIPAGLEFLLCYGFQSQNKLALNHVNLTLTKMACGGIYDQVGGGFARYSVDKYWKVPHFEKMLYDNGQLISLYARAYMLSKNNLFEEIIKRTLQFIKRELSSPEGAFYSSFDADSEGVEGKYYVWTKKEITALLGVNADWFCNYFNVTENGNWDGSNILWVTGATVYDKSNNHTSLFTEQQLNESLSKLFEYRKLRIAPALDDKILTSWNAIMAIGYLDAFEALGSKEYLNTALNTGNFIVNNMFRADGSLVRNYKAGSKNIPGLLDDYAFTIQLFIRLYQNTFDEKWILQAKRLTEFVIKYFYDEKSGMFFYTSAISHDLLVRKMEFNDHVIPSSNSTMGNNLLILGTLFENDLWKTMARQMLTNIIPKLTENAAYYGNWGLLLSKLNHPFYEIVITGDDSLKLKQKLSTHYLPNTLICGTTQNESSLPLIQNRWVENETNIHICVNNTCLLPVKTVEEVLAKVQSLNP
jgi:uncharacterized protein YyaL (SSP411 family)